MSVDPFVFDEPDFARGRGPTPLGGPRNQLVKRSFDILVSASLIVLLAPVMLVIAGVICIQDGAPVLFGHRRVGRKGKQFACLKFRTMVRDADIQLKTLLATDMAARAEWEKDQKLKDDPRIIPGIGHFLRKTSLDELPQLFNVLFGDMSMVGPRPVVEDELKRYGAHRVHYLSVRPGLTGPWQVGERSDGDYEDRVQQDVKYIEKGTFMDDVRIIFQTARVPFSDRGAY